MTRCTQPSCRQAFQWQTGFNASSTSSEDFRFDPSYPDLKSERTENFALIEVLWSVGRSVKVKKKLLEELMASLSRQGLDPEHVMVCFKETSWENWSFGGGRLIHT